MRIAGKKIEAISESVVVIPRAEGDIIFKAVAVKDTGEFEKICKAPAPPMVMRPGGVTVANIKDPKYIKDLNNHAEYRTHWLILESLKATEDLEWETVDSSDPDTWGNFKDELKESGFSDLEIKLIIDAVIDANGLNADKIEKATKSFLATQRQQQEEQDSLSIEQSDMPFGEPVND